MYSQTAQFSAAGAVPTYVDGGLGKASGQEGEASQTRINNIVVAHGIIAGIAIVVILPVGALMMRLFRFQGLIWVHASLQAIGLFLLLIGFGLGVWASVLNNQVCSITTFRPTPLCLLISFIGLQ